MADNKSCEENIKETFREQQRKLWDQFGAPVDDMKIGIDYANPGKDLTVRLTADVSDAIKDLKAIQREARQATAALKEFEQAYNKVKPVADQCGISGQEITALLIESRGDN